MSETVTIKLRKLEFSKVIQFVTLGSLVLNETWHVQVTSYKVYCPPNSKVIARSVQEKANTIYNSHLVYMLQIESVILIFQ